MTQALPISRFWIVALISEGPVCALNLYATWKGVLQAIEEANSASQIVVYYIRATDASRPVISDVTPVAITCAAGGVPAVAHEVLPAGSIEFYSEELEYCKSTMQYQRGSFMTHFIRACLHADGENFQLMLPVLRDIMAKYPLKRPTDVPAPVRPAETSL